MTEQHPITPPLELRLQWKQEWLDVRPSLTNYAEWLLAKTARWGYEQRGAVNEAELQKARDEELDACCEYLTRCAAWEPEDVKEFCDLRRPEPPSLKEQALAELELLRKDADTHGLGFDALAIRRALESLPD